MLYQMLTSANNVALGQNHPKSIYLIEHIVTTFSISTFITRWNNVSKSSPQTTFRASSVHTRPTVVQLRNPGTGPSHKVQAVPGTKLLLQAVTIPAAAHFQTCLTCWLLGRRMSAAPMLLFLSRFSCLSAFSVTAPSDGNGPLFPSIPVPHSFPPRSVLLSVYISTFGSR